MRLLCLPLAIVLSSALAAPLKNWGATAGVKKVYYHDRAGPIQDGVHSTDWCHDESLMDITIAIASLSLNFHEYLLQRSLEGLTL